MSTTNDPLIGTTAGAYVLERLLGRGAMGTVYLAHHQENGQRFAIKFLSGDFAHKKEFVTRFHHEANACATMNHENVIHVFDAGEDDGLHYMVMEYVDGVSLSHFLEVQEKVRESQALPWMKRVALALAYAHSQGIVHRDLKPENIMLTHEGVVKLADLGLSKTLDADDSLSMTMSGTVIGTPYYISPEQTRDAKRVDARTDIYSLGATFYHLCAGRPPFHGTSAADVMAKHMNEQAVPPQRINVALSDGFGAIILKMMEKDPDDRFQSMQEVVESIERLERGEAVFSTRIRFRKHHAAVALPVKTSGMPRWQSAWPLGAAILAVLLIIGAALAFLMHGQGTSKTEPFPLPSSFANVTTPATPSPVAAEPAAPPPKAESSAPAQGGTGDLVLRGEARVPVPSGNLTWIDAIAVACLAAGMWLCWDGGARWGLIRAITLVVATWIAITYFDEAGARFGTPFGLPENPSQVIAFFGLSALLMIPVWVLTRQLPGHDPGTWRSHLSHILTLGPGLVVGATLAVWLIACLGVLTSDTALLSGSWTGSQVMQSFPSLEKMMTPPAKR
ncbi:MAG: protein kinase [Phycisphaerales bacterium]|jgi:serine/threonine protein kinase